MILKIWSSNKFCQRMMHMALLSNNLLFPPLLLKITTHSVTLNPFGVESVDGLGTGEIWFKVEREGHLLIINFKME